MGEHAVEQMKILLLNHERAENGVEDGVQLRETGKG